MLSPEFDICLLVFWVWLRNGTNITRPSCLMIGIWPEKERP